MVSRSELILVDNPKCGYFKTYEISVDKYKNPDKLFRDKKSGITKQIVKELNELSGLKFQLSLTIEFFKEADATRKVVTGVLHVDQMTILTSDKIDEFYNKSPAQIQTGIKKFTNTASGLEIDHCIKLFLNIAKYDPLKGSSYIPLPKALENKKAIINVKNNDNERLKWALLSALYPDDSTHKNEVSRYRKYAHNLNMDGIDFPTPINTKSKETKQPGNQCLWIYNVTEEEKDKHLSIYPSFHISNQVKETQRINLLLMSEDVEVVNEDTDDSGENCDPDAEGEPQKETIYITTVGLKI